MDMSSVMQIGAQLLQSKLSQSQNGNSTGGNLDIGSITSALMGLMGGGQGQTGGVLGGLTSMLSNMHGGGGDLMSMAASWIGSGANVQPSASQVGQILGNDKVAAFAQQLGISHEAALDGLSHALPAVVDKATPSGSLDMGSILDSVGGVSGAIGLASKLFGR